MLDDADEFEDRGGGAGETLLLLVALGLIAMPAISNIARRWRLGHPVARDETSVDKSLKDSFPASDPPSSRYFDIPVNRR